MISVYFANHDKDKGFRSALETALIMLKRNRQVSFTGHDEVGPGLITREVIAKRIKEAGLILLLVTPDYLSDDWHYEEERPLLLAAHHFNRTPIIPIHVRHVVGWEDCEFNRFLALPRKGGLADPENLMPIVQDIKLTVEGLLK